ncbi:MAG: peptidylprolyl isomerase [Alistipes sp.]|nr:peptidylprolyl isomerase [Alistipes sp.]MBR2331244.1 peptidylprolyl isomerase [Alistipes sp.]
MNKRFLSAILIVCIIFSASFLAAQKRQVMLDRVVAIVGSSAILYSDVTMFAQQIVNERRSQGYTSDRDPMNESLEALMKQKLLFNQSQIDSIEFGTVDDMVSEQIDAMIAEAGSVSKLEEQQHMKIFNLRQLLRTRISEQKGAGAMQNHVISDVTITPGEVEIYYKGLKEEEIPLVPEQYIYAQIVRYPSSQAEAKLRTKERLLEMRERIISGKSTIDLLARTYSDDPGTAMRGGLMSSTTNELTPPFADALAELKPGQVSEVVETEFGFHIIQLQEEPKNNIYTFRHILLKPDYTVEELVEPIEFLDSINRLIRSDSLKFEDAAALHSHDTYSQKNGGLVTNHDVLTKYPQLSNVKFSATKFKKDDFGGQGGKSLADYYALSKLKVGEISNAFSSEDLNGNELARIVKLLEVIPTHSATLAEDYLTIEEKALNDKKLKVFNKWLEEKIDQHYVYVDPEFRNGEFEFKNWIK